MKENKHFTVGTLQEFSMVRNIQKSSDCKVHGHIPIGDQSLFWKKNQHIQKQHKNERIFVSDKKNRVLHPIYHQQKYLNSHYDR